jgi:hypothetical protein
MFAFNRRVARIAVALVGFLVPLACDSTPKTAEKSAPPTTTDPRTPVALPADGQQAVLREMRQMLGAIGGALSGAARQDPGAARGWGRRSRIPFWLAWHASPDPVPRAMRHFASRPTRAHPSATVNVGNILGGAGSADAFI